MSTPEEGDRTLRLIAAVIAAEAAGWASFEVAPLVVSALMDAFSFGEAAAGGLASAELIALAVAMLASAGSMARHSRARLGLAGACIAIAGHVHPRVARREPRLTLRSEPIAIRRLVVVGPPEHLELPFG